MEGGEQRVADVTGDAGGDALGIDDILGGGSDASPGLSAEVPSPTAGARGVADSRASRGIGRGASAAVSPGAAADRRRTYDSAVHRPPPVEGSTIPCTHCSKLGHMASKCPDLEALKHERDQLIVNVRAAFARARHNDVS